MAKWVRVVLLIVLIAVVAVLPEVVEKMREDELDLPETGKWEGIISCAVVPSFPTVNLNGWLNASFAGFEKGQEKVLVSLKEMTEEGVKVAADEGNLPDILFFGVTMEDSLGCFVSSAAPVAKGGYGLLGNVNLLDTVGWSPNLSPQEAAGLLSDNDLTIAAPLFSNVSTLDALNHYGDFSSVSVVGDQPHAKVWSGFVLENEFAFYVATQREIRRMETLRASGKGIETVLVPIPWTDQVLLCGIVRQELTQKGKNEDRQRVCGELMEYLLSEEAQNAISKAALFPVTKGLNVYESDTQMAFLEAALS